MTNMDDPTNPPDATAIFARALRRITDPTKVTIAEDATTAGALDPFIVSIGSDLDRREFVRAAIEGMCDYYVHDPRYGHLYRQMLHSAVAGAFRAEQAGHATATMGLVHAIVQRWRRGDLTGIDTDDALPETWRGLASALDRHLRLARREPALRVMFRPSDGPGWVQRTLARLTPARRRPWLPGD